MARPNRLDEQRAELLPILAKAFGELGFRRATTAELARRCGVRENILYRHWPEKVAMFTATIDHVRELATSTWRRVLDASNEPEAEQLIDYESDHLGEFGNYRLIFSALADTDNDAIRAGLVRLYREFFAVLHDGIDAARGNRTAAPDTELATWAVIGLGTVATIAEQLDLLSKRKRRRLLREVGRMLTKGRRAS